MKTLRLVLFFEVEEKMKFYIIGPVCGAKLGKAEAVRNMDLQCFKCKSLLTIDISNEKLMVELTGEKIKQ